MATKYKIGKDGLYHAFIWDGTYNKDGTKHRKNIRSSKSSADLEKKVQLFEESVRLRKAVVRSDYTIKDYAERWLTVFKPDIAVRTAEMYHRILDIHFKSIHCVKLSDISLIHFQTIMNEASGKKRTQQQIQLTFKQILKTAVSEHLYPANVAQDIFFAMKPVRYKAKERRVLTENEKKAVFLADLDSKDRIFLFLLYGCGLRREEVLALTKGDFNLEKHTVSIDKAIIFDKKGFPIQKDPKSQHGYRTVPIPGNVFPAIREYVMALTFEESRLFIMSTNKPLTKSSFRRKWKRIINAMSVVTGTEINGLTPHVFRHNFCTNLCYQIPIVSVKRIAQLLGDTENMVLNVYNHVILAKEDAEGAIENATAVSLDEEEPEKKKKEKSA